MIFPFLRGDAGRSVSLRQDRVHLRPPRMSDWQVWAELREVSRDFLVPWEPTWPRDALSKAAFRRRLDHVRQEWEQETGYSFLVFRAADEVLVGGVTLSNVRRGVAQTASLGYWVGAPYARQGYMSEALLAILRFAFESLGLHRMEAACLERNEASRRLLEKSGFGRIGYARQYLKIDGRWQDHVLFERLRNDPKGDPSGS